MSTPESSNTEYFPPPYLYPVTNARNVWTAVLLAVSPGTRLDHLARLFDEFGLDEALGAMPCIVPLADPTALSNALAQQLPIQRITLLIPLAHCVDPLATGDMERLRLLGFRVMAEGLPPPGDKLHEAVTAIAVDAPDSGNNAPPKILRHLPGPHLAVRTDTPACFAQTLAAGCSLFAGEYPLHPPPNQQQHGPSRALLLKLLGLVASDAEAHAIEVLLKQTPELSYQLLKLVNSVSFSLANKISNFRQAIAILGRRQLQRWLQLLLYAQNRGDAHNPLMDRAALRASLIEALCKASGGDREEQERGFMVGMFSLLEALFAMPLEDILTPLNLAEDVVDALLKRGGRIGAVLALVEQSEHAPGPDFAERLAAVGLTPASYCQSLVQACRWTIQVNREI
ncbi:MAG: HDOD domain-containing protein [Proteobacteria bacterium]|nr:HDOD domain-containing protein [Pseudomonadota bacterium]